MALGSLVCGVSSKHSRGLLTLIRNICLNMQWTKNIFVYRQLILLLILIITVEFLENVGDRNVFERFKIERRGG